MATTAEAFEFVKTYNFVSLFPQNQNMQKRAFEVVIIFIVTSICLSISFYQTMIGYQDAFGGLVVSGLFAFVIVLLLFFINYKIRDNRIKGKDTALMLVLYVVFTFVSFAGNFNAFFSQFMRAKLIDSEFEIVQKKLTDVYNTLGNTYPPLQKSKKIDALKKQLKDQINDPKNYGVGNRAIELINELRAEDVPLTLLQCDHTEEDARRVANKYWESITEQQNNLVKGWAQIDTTYQRLTKTFQNLVGKKDDVQKQAHINKALELYANLRGMYANATKDDKTFPAMDKNYDGIGRLDQSFRLGFGDYFYWAGLLAMVVSLFIDLFVPIIIMAVTEREEQNDDDYYYRGFNN